MFFTYITPDKTCDRLLELGRVTRTDDGLLMDWSACGFSLRFAGSGISFAFMPHRADMPVYVMAILDGIRTKFAVDSGFERFMLACEDGEHTLSFLRLSEGGDPLVCREIRITAENGQSAPALLPPPAPKERRIVYFGDSITCGYGNLGDPRSGFYTCEEDPTLAYAYRSAELCDADAELVSISGQGVVLNCNGDIGTPIPTFYKWQSRTLQTPCDFSLQPDVVVVNAGTNDGGAGHVSQEAMFEGACAFVKNLRLAYPKAEIVWFYGLMGEVYGEALTKAEAVLADTDARFTYVPCDMIYGKPGEVGANGHPSVEGAERGAQVLAAKIKEIMNW